MTSNKRSGSRVLIVEDQSIIAMEIENILAECGCVAVGPAGTLTSALLLARAEALDAAILDVNLDGEQVFPVAEELQARGIPFVFATGYGRSSLPEKWQDAPRLDKPFKSGALEIFLETVFAD